MALRNFGKRFLPTNKADADVLATKDPSPEPGRNHDYPLVNSHITMENHHFLWDNSLFQWQFSIYSYVTNYQRVYHMLHMFMYLCCLNTGDTQAWRFSKGKHLEIPWEFQVPKATNSSCYTSAGHPIYSCRNVCIYIYDIHMCIYIYVYHGNSMSLSMYIYIYMYTYTEYVYLCT